MMRIYAAVAQKEWELISGCTKAALAAAKACGAVLGGDRGFRPACGPDATLVGVARRKVAEQAAHRVAIDIERLREGSVTSHAAMARALNERGVPVPSGRGTWTYNGDKGDGASNCLKFAYADCKAVRQIQHP
ncbi:hypothetical protein QWZ14_09540 [Paeniroseomonas aquatica]|uniref:Resolvase/invertase-type recombinase catalytic domain-containing protein n=1 Tax=Paeniroseomonas aquatica TaxID=373043 RepID=A0ABT8A4L6_9PROT|nr:hypothetical protein [Paeniroseomonas aquatica]MDN3564605.1 hypothetical protein [Paeniroseomonas aquatica]